jgi:hypothetical protein
MITERDFLTHMGSIWNSRKIRTGVFASSTEKKFLLVEGKLDAVLVSSMGEEIPFTPIAVSYLAHSEQKDDYIVTETTHEGRGKNFVIDRIRQKHPNEFGLVDMDYDYQQKKLTGIKERAVDTSEAMTLIGKVVAKKLTKFIEDFIQRLFENTLITKGEASELTEQIIFSRQQVKVLSMQRFLRHTKSTFNKDWICKISKKHIFTLHDELKSICPNNVNYINDHDLEDVMISFFQPTVNQHVVKRELDSFILKLAKESKHKIVIGVEGIKWV